MVNCSGNIFHLATTNCKRSCGIIFKDNTVVTVLNSQVSKRCIVYAGTKVNSVIRTIFNNNILYTYTTHTRGHIQEAVLIVSSITVRNCQFTCTLRIECIRMFSVFAIKVTILDDDIIALRKCHRTGVGLACAVDGYVLRNSYVLGNVCKEGDGVAGLCVSDSFGKSFIRHITYFSYKFSFL